MDKPKRDEKAKRGFRRRYLLISVLSGVIVLLAGAGWYLYENSRICGCDPNPLEITSEAMTDTAALNAASAGTATMSARVETAVALTAAPDRPAATPTEFCNIERVYGDDAETADRLTDLLEQSGIDSDAVFVRFDGEDSFCYQNGERRSARVLIRWIRLELVVPLPEDDTPEAKGALIIAILNAIEPVKFAYPQTITIIFQSAAGVPERWTRDYTEAYEALGEGVTPADLYAAGK